MFKNIKNTTLISLLVLVYACSFNSKPINLVVKECFYPDSPKNKAPLWVCGAPVAVEGVEVKHTGVGSASKSKAGIQFTVQQAAAAARLDLAQQLNAVITSSVKNSVESRGYGTEEQVTNLASLLSDQTTNQNLIGSKVLAQTVSPNNTIYIIVGLNTDAYKDALKNIFNATQGKTPLSNSQINNIRNDVENSTN